MAYNNDKKMRDELLIKIKTKRFQLINFLNETDNYEDELCSQSRHEEDFSSADDEDFIDKEVIKFECKPSKTSHYFGYSLPVLGSKEDFDQKYQMTDDLLGKGDFGTVHKGFRCSDNTLIAIKKIKTDKLRYWGVSNGLHYPMEFCILQKLKSCDGAIKLMDAYNFNKNEFVMVTEILSDSCTLSHWIESIWFYQNDFGDEKVAKSLFSDLIKSVDQVHQNGVYHRDIIASNILINMKTMKLTLIDFGISDLIDNSPYSDTKHCVLDVMAPEMRTDGCINYHGLPAEVYTLGIILHDLIFAPDRWNITCRCLGCIQPDPFATIQCLDLIDKMLNNCPEERPTLKEILDHPWMQQ